jgi:hypothetical protein
LLTGHFRLDHPIFRRIGVPHFTVTTLRDPISRMLSNYNHALLTPGNLWHEEVVSGRMPFIEHAAKIYAAVGPQYSFFDDTGRGTFAPTGRATPQCLHNLLTKVTFYGLTERFDEFSLLFGCLAGRHRILGVPRGNVTIEIENPDKIAPKRAVTASERDELSELLKEDIWFYQEAVKEYDRRLSDPRLEVIFKRVLPMVRHYDPVEAENRKLRLGGGATFEELEAAGKAGGGRAYRFDDLLSLSPTSAAPAPPLVFIHVPKTAGAIVNQILMKNYRYRFDSYGDEFFPRYFPNEFVSLVGPPLPNDMRRPAFFTGAIDMANDVFRYMPVRYVVITLLRDPIERMITHYRDYSSSHSTLREEMRSGKFTVLDFVRRFYPRNLLQHEIFAPQSRQVADAVHALENDVSLFGFQDRFDEFIVLMQDLLGLPDIVHAPLNSTPEDAAPVEASHIDELREILAKDIMFYNAARELYARRIAGLNPGLTAAVERFRREQVQTLAHRRSDHVWTRFYA